MNFINELTNKPWLAGRPGRKADREEGGAFSLPTATLGLRMFMGVATVLFSLFIVAYADRMALADWRRPSEPWLMWPNTALLALSSAAMHWAWLGAHRQRPDRLRIGLLAGGILAFAFLAGQLLAWRQMAAMGYFADTNPANAFFYLFTALHGLHLLGGLAAWGGTTARAWRGDRLARLRLSVELCAVYWHFLLVVWLVLFALLLFA